MKKLLMIFVSLSFCLLFTLPVFFAKGQSGFSVSEGKIDREYDLGKKDAIIRTILQSEDGISFRLDSDKEKLLLSLKAVKIAVEYPDGLEVTDYYSPYIRRYVSVGGKRVNMQIAVDLYGNVTVGTPVIYGSY